MSTVQWENMCEILEERCIGCAEVTKFDAQGFYAIRENIRPGTYVKLEVNGELMMSNTAMEKRTATEFVSYAEGDVLICGLGIGLVIMPLLKDDQISSITVIEKYQDVIDCVLPQLKQYDAHNKLQVICQDCFEFNTRDKYDSIYLDIWPYINEDIYKEEMKPLKRKYRSFLSEKGKQTKNIHVWAEDYAKNDWRLY